MYCNAYDCTPNWAQSHNNFQFRAQRGTSPSGSIADAPRADYDGSTTRPRCPHLPSPLPPSSPGPQAFVAPLRSSPRSHEAVVASPDSGSPRLSRARGPQHHHSAPCQTRPTPVHSANTCVIIASAQESSQRIARQQNVEPYRKTVSESCLVGRESERESARLTLRGSRTARLR